MQSCPDIGYTFILNYQDHNTKFLYLRPLKNKTERGVAFELLTIFLIQAAPMVLQSNNGREFVAEVIKELIQLWPECKIVHGSAADATTTTTLLLYKVYIYTILYYFILCILSSLSLPNVTIEHSTMKLYDKGLDCWYCRHYCTTEGRQRSN